MKESAANHIKSFILPLVALIIIPGAILWATGFRIGWGLGMLWDIIIVLVGALLMGAGLYCLSVTIWLFDNIGRGTLAPWSPTSKLVVIGPYRYVRNPMISGVLMTLLGESVVFGSIGIFIWFVLFFIINHMYFMYSEEPGLEKRFGQEYLVYKKNVPRWIPRLRPWTGQ
ncbi:MAG: isoprenylcysteine carboxylmethyltransferase family protein [Dehalococcoidia bacterium]